MLNKTSFVQTVRNDLQEALNILLFLAKFSCTIPLNVNILEKNQNAKSYKWRICGAIQLVINSVFLGLIPVLCIFCNFYKTKNIDGIATLTKIFHYVRYICFITSIVCITFGFHYNRRKYSYFFENYVEIFSTLRKNNGQISFHILKRKINSMIVFWIIFFIGFSIIVCNYNFNQKTDLVVLQNIFIYLLPNWINVVAIMVYCTAIFMIKICFEMVNNNLMTLSNRKGKIVFVSAKILDSNKILSTMRDIHFKLQLLYEEISECFEFLLLLTMLMSFSSLTVNFYTIYQLNQVEKISKNGLIMFTFALLYSFLHITKVLNVLYVNEKAQLEVSINCCQIRLKSMSKKFMK